VKLEDSLELLVIQKVDGRTNISFGDLGLKDSCDTQHRKPM